MGRKRIEIKKINEPRARRATFGKRKSGLIKKAWEFGELTGSKVFLIIQDERKTKFSFTTSKEDLYLKYDDIEPENRMGPEDFALPQTTSSSRALSPTGGEIVCATRLHSLSAQTQVTGTTENEEMPRLILPDRIAMDVCEDLMPIAGDMANRTFPPSCFTPIDMQCYMPSSTTFVNPNMLSISGNSPDVDSMDIFSLSLPGLFSPSPSSMEFQPLDESMFSQNSSNAFGYLEAISPLAVSSCTTSASNWLLSS